MDISIKETIKKINEIRVYTELVNLVRHGITLNDRIREKIDLKLTAETLGYTKITYKKTSHNDQLVRRRIIKLFNDELPTKHMWYQCISDLYKMEICVFYDQTKEDNGHVFTC